MGRTNGKTAVVPKDEGMGVMINAFKSHEFGSGLQLNNEQLERVNMFHEGKNYLDEDAATAIRAQQQRNHSPQVPSSKSLNMALLGKVIGLTSTWFCS